MQAKQIPERERMSSALFDLGGRTALVTGSSRGLGRAIAEGLAAAGAGLVLNGVDDGRLAEAAAAMRAAGQSGRESRFDVTDEASVAAAFESFDRDGVAIDILVNNAGIQFRKPMAELALADWQRVIDTNLTSAFVVGREAARRMIPRGRGKIVNIGSVMSGLARPTIAPYTVAKAGIKALTQAMTAEWAQHGVQANAIGPGYMITDMNKALIEDEAFNAWVTGRTPSRRWGRPEELVGAAVFLSSAASDYVSGQIIYVDGGMVAVV
jgi:gluconate 5-dehydrogenase